MSDDSPQDNVGNNVGGWIQRWARRRGAQLAIADDERRLDYASLDARIARLAGALQERGIGPGDRIAVLLANRSAFLEAIFAAARMGAIALPVNTRLSPREICFLLDDCSPSALFYESDLAKIVAAACGRARRAPPLLCPVGGAGDAYEPLLAGATPLDEIRPVSPDDPMMLMYTSGTTGKPKGALLPHRKSLFNSLNAQLFFGIRGEDRVLVTAPLFHSLGLQILAIPLLYAGGSLVLQSRFDAAAVLETVERERISYFGGVPTYYQRIHDLIEERGVDAFDLGSLRFLFTAGAAIPVDLIHAFEGYGLVLKQGYGQTETSILCCLDERDAVRKAGSVGRPVFHAELRVVAQESLAGPARGWRDVAPTTPEGAGETGEIIVRGPIAMLGYWQRPEASAETLREGWVLTGDLATVDDEGFVSLVGRARDMYISGGENVYPAEVEAVFREHPAVREIAVVGRPDPRWGEVGHAYVVPANERDLDPAALIEWAEDRLASFKMPKRFIAAQSLPRTASGKVQKHRLAAEGS
ncbi:MAG: long-chain fatty acid--CoA ligase [Deltaproteobacteria bacterium]|nr:long-chain fatty acid--CoA ligase [Deltaproteobacteria bacterium]MBW2417777.1 long-chain fatty acid--CoA ligase [Deltaproteobacteria bacterium]